MSLQGIFNTSVQAMLSQSQAMSNISSNIANVNTTAYKLQDTHFATLLNHIQLTDNKFFTVNTFDFRQVDKQGAITTTNRTFDLALNGRGFIVTNTEEDPTSTNSRWQCTRAACCNRRCSGRSKPRCQMNMPWTSSCCRRHQSGLTAVSWRSASPKLRPSPFNQQHQPRPLRGRRYTAAPLSPMLRSGRLAPLPNGSPCPRKHRAQAQRMAWPDKSRSGRTVRDPTTCVPIWP